MSSQQAVKFNLKDLPAEVFPSLDVNPVGMLSMAPPTSGPRLDVDFEVMAALDDDAEFDDDWAIDEFLVEAKGEVTAEEEKKWKARATGRFELDDDDDGDEDDRDSG